MTLLGPPVAAVIGSPIAHSLSPVIHRAAFDAAGLDWSYVAFDVAPGEGAAAVSAMRTLGLRGLSVTMPHKEAVATAVDRLDPPAAALGAVNTVSWVGDELVGWSTDGDGFVDSLVEEGVSVEGQRVVVFGAGGAARSVIDALDRAGAAEIVIINRSAQRAAHAVALAGAARRGGLADAALADLVVNATSLGMGVDPALAGPADLPCDPDTLAADTVVADLVYQPRETAWLRRVRARGLHTIDGLGMLVHQAARQQEIWTGRRPAVASLWQAAVTELDRRAATSDPS